MLPGTEIMADIDGVHFVHAQNSASSAVLVPQPSEDPHDPLVRSLPLSQLCSFFDLQYMRTIPFVRIFYLLFAARCRYVLNT